MDQYAPGTSQPSPLVSLSLVPVRAMTDTQHSSARASPLLASAHSMDRPDISPQLPEIDISEILGSLIRVARLLSLVDATPGDLIRSLGSNLYSSQEEITRIRYLLSQAMHLLRQLQDSNREGISIPNSLSFQPNLAFPKHRWELIRSEVLDDDKISAAATIKGVAWDVADCADMDPFNFVKFCSQYDTRWKDLQQSDHQDDLDLIDICEICC
ncbi:hypothetical protein M406DRAFT_74114 [Cryphonectria parasitica EP155]|uniref:Uncharacterized protein n=1 Tax=Cryphonectria parasitica (strain ATCC 38755 / EP155) TaxID=660469 RepID=A0A9P5CLW8_CRYP1|nr:uncharacterized protein M406DRAFT_74114 [Cryphonectria parasitica EP155]KAF3763518.1 hypothetical protein M406DRAFT_74114 [Cryphonectria parasitica EP155]